MDAEFFNFLKAIGVLRDFNESFKKYFDNINEGGPKFECASIVILLKYNYENLAQASKQQLDYMILEPGLYERKLHHIISGTVNEYLEKNSKSFKLQTEQIHCIHQFSGLPLTEEYKFYPKIKTSLSNFTCIVAGRGEVKTYMRQTVWYCESKCVPNVIASAPPKCDLCLTTMKEYVELRDMSEYVMLNVLPLEAVQTPKCIGKFDQKFNVILLDSWADWTRLNVVCGNAYIITGTYNIIERVFCASNIVEMQDE